MLKVAGLNAWYDRSHVVQNIAFEVRAGEIVTLMGRNGAGKTTTLRTLMGLVTKRSGSMHFNGRDMLAEPAHTRFHQGLAYVPEERRIVPGLSVRENLQLGITASSNRHEMARMIEEIATTFPRLKERLEQDATSMSGGEQQMLAIARAMMARPQMILLDEPSEGIMPLLVDEMFQLFVRMKQAGTTILLVNKTSNGRCASGPGLHPRPRPDRPHRYGRGVAGHQAIRALLRRLKLLQFKPPQAIYFTRIQPAERRRQLKATVALDQPNEWIDLAQPVVVPRLDGISVGNRIEVLRRRRRPRPVGVVQQAAAVGVVGHRRRSAASSSARA
ncbi:ABC transporter ATP-binding protein [Roseateles sp. GG27B]